MKTSVLFIVIALFSLHCDQGTSPENIPPQIRDGNVTLSLVASSIPAEVKVISARLERDGFATLKDSVVVSGVIDSVKFRFAGVASGTWSVTVDAKDNQGAVRYTGKSTVSVSDNLTTQIQIVMSPVAGGGVQITLVWNLTRYQWTMSSENPVVRQTVGTWDQNNYYCDDPAVLKINGTYQMWYSTGTTMGSLPTDTLWIAYATSTDGIHWAKWGSLFGPGAIGTWRDKGVISPCVMYDGGIYKMWFVGAKNPTQYQNGIGYATSADGKSWTIDAQPVIPVSVSMGATWHPAVLKKDNLFYLYVGTSSTHTVYSSDIEVMTSADGRTWTDLGVKLSARMDAPSQRSGIFPSEVMYDENKFKMFFTAVQNSTLTIGYAESPDGISWTNLGEPPAMVPSNTSPWSTVSVGFPSVMRDGGTLKMWFSAVTSSPSRYQIGYAEQVK